MPTTKARWKPAPRDQRRVAVGRTAPKARFTRGQARSLPVPLRAQAGIGAGRPLLLIAGIMGIMVALSVLLVIGVGTLIQAQQRYDDLQGQAAYYGRPTLPFATLALDAEQRTPGAATTSPLRATALPSSIDAILSVSSSDAALTEPDGASGGTRTNLTSYCDKFGIPAAIHIFDWNDWSTIELTNPLVAQLPISWDASADLWRGYQSAKPFDQPDDVRDRWRLQLFTADGTERWIQIAESVSTPDTLYAYAFQIITPYSDSNGNHYGYHPCRAFAVPTSDMYVLLSSARAYQSSGSRFPAFAAPDDSGWQRGSATPLNGSFELRSIPMLENNAPLQIINNTVSGYFITEVDWGVWAQIKLGNTTAWIDTSTVRLEAAP